jgi:cyclopropane fatty-acyl-phospholipid synthase-like methyltransferase
MMDNDTAQKLAQSLTAESADIIPFLPYLLQDLWELGSSGAEMADLLRQHVTLSPGFTALDLGCGKGAVSVTLASQLGIRCKGIDIMEDFIRTAKQKAAERGVSHLCEFAAGDIICAIGVERGYDLVIYGAVGRVLGTPAEMLNALKATVRPGGYILLDDAYHADDAENPLSGEYPSLAEWRALIEQSGLVLIALSEAAGRPEDDERDFQCIRKRALELTKACPQHREKFERYVQSQRDEYDDLAERLVGAAFLLQKPVSR